MDSSKEFRSLNLAVSTYCSMSCPDCCMDVPHRDKVHYSWSYFERAAECLHGAFEVITLTGGEPTIHPQFTEFAPRFKELFGCTELHIETNGYGFTKFPDAFGCFDQISCTIYTPNSFPGCPDNRRIIETFSKHPNGRKLNAGLTVFVPRARPTNGGTCLRYGLMAYFDGLLYGCCVAPGVDKSSGISLDKDWRARIKAAPVPCSNCFFAL